MKSFKCLLILLCSSCLLTSCYDRIEVNDIAIVVASAIDMDDEGLYRVSAQLPLPGQMGGGSGGGGGNAEGSKGYYVDSGTGKTLREAVDNLQSRMSRKMLFSHRRVVIISEKLAKKGISEIFEVTARLPDNRMSSYVAISKEDGYKILQADTQFERFSGETVREMAKFEGIMHINMRDMAQDMNTKGSDALSIYINLHNSEKSDNPSKEVQISGYTQFKKDRMVDIFPMHHSYGLKWLKNNREPHNITFPWYDHGNISVQIHNYDIDVRPKLENDQVHFHIYGLAEAEVLEDYTDLDLRIQENIDNLDNRISSEIKKSIEEVIEKIQKHQADSAGFGSKFSRSYPKEWNEYYKQNWDEELKKAKFTINIKCKITGIGRVTNNISKKGADS